MAGVDTHTCSVLRLPLHAQCCFSERHQVGCSYLGLHLLAHAESVKTPAPLQPPSGGCLWRVAGQVPAMLFVSGCPVLRCPLYGTTNACCPPTVWVSRLPSTHQLSLMQGGVGAASAHFGWKVLVRAGQATSPCAAHVAAHAVCFAAQNRCVDAVRRSLVRDRLCGGVHGRALASPFADCVTKGAVERAHSTKRCPASHLELVGTGGRQCRQRVRPVLCLSA